MTTCAVCSKRLQPAWKYCIYCGAKVEAVPPTKATAAAKKSIVVKPPPVENVPPAEKIPAAIRPESTSPARRRPTPLTQFAFVILALGAILVVIGIIISVNGRL